MKTFLVALLVCCSGIAGLSQEVHRDKPYEYEDVRVSATSTHPDGTLEIHAQGLKPPREFIFACQVSQGSCFAPRIKESYYLGTSTFSSKCDGYRLCQRDSNPCITACLKSAH